MNNIRTVSFTYEQLREIDNALTHALQHGLYETPEQQCIMHAAREEVREASKRPNIEDVLTYEAEWDGSVCGLCKRKNDCPASSPQVEQCSTFAKARKDYR